jgi:hypothetical protein
VALYEGLRHPRADDPEPSPRWQRLHLRQGGRSQQPWLDRLLGQGSAQTLGRAVGTALAPRRREAPAPRRPSPAPAFRPQRLQAVGSGQAALPQGRRGVIRGLLLLIGLLWIAALLKPWQRVGAIKMDVSALFASAESRTARQKAVEEAQAQADARLAALPVIAAGGEPLALWQSGTGRWYGVDGDGLLSPFAGPQVREALGLPQLQGASAQSEPYKDGRRLRLKLPDGLLKSLLPLAQGVASEARGLRLDRPDEPVLITHDGAECRLRADQWELGQERLAMVLADLAARRSRAAMIDLRFEDSAVVRPAGR